MARTKLASMTVDELVLRFREIALRQYEADFEDKIKLYNRLYDDMVTVREELRSRPGDQRRALLPLLAHQNPQVRLMAANTLLAVEPDVARQALQRICDHDDYPQKANARGMLTALAKGTYLPT